MLAQQRQQEILNRIEIQGTVRTIELARELNVTDETIRRDLQILADAQQVVRIHGGAMKRGARPAVMAHTERTVTNVEYKRVISLEAQSFIRPGETIAFDSSTTVMEVVKRIPDQTNLRVVTNGLNVIEALANRPDIELICPGGRYYRDSVSFSAMDSAQSLKRYNIHKLFISCIGLDLERGASEATEEQARLKQNLINQSEQVILLVDHTKLGKRSDFFYADMNDLTTVVTDSLAEPVFIDRLRQSGITVRVAR